MSLNSILQSVLDDISANQINLQNALTSSQGQTITATTGTVTQDTDLWVIESELVGSDYVAVVQLPNPDLNSYITFDSFVTPTNATQQDTVTATLTLADSTQSAVNVMVSTLDGAQFNQVEITSPVAFELKVSVAVGPIVVTDLGNYQWLSEAPVSMNLNETTVFESVPGPSFPPDEQIIGMVFSRNVNLTVNVVGRTPLTESSHLSYATTSSETNWNISTWDSFFVGQDPDVPTTLQNIKGLVIDGFGDWTLELTPTAII